MGEISSDTKVHVVRAAQWKDAIITLLEPSSPHRPWGETLSAKPGDAILAILDTDPPAVIAEVLRVDSDGGPDCLQAGFMTTEQNRRPALLELATLTALTGLSPIECDGKTVESSARLVEVLGERIQGDWELSYLHGHSTLAAARILLNSGGWCTGCQTELDLAGANARYHVHIHTVDADPATPTTPVAYVPELTADRDEYGPSAIPIHIPWRPVRLPLDWPAVLCDDCHDRMRIGGFTGFLDYRFSRHPRCPQCSARWTLRTIAGFHPWLPKDPWLRYTGCVPQEKWQCGACGHGFDDEVISEPQED